MPDSSPPGGGARAKSEALRSTAEGAAALDAYLDRRWNGSAAETQVLIAQIGAAGLTLSDVEQMLRAGRASYPAEPVGVGPGKLATNLPLDCDHVDYSTTYCLYVPRAYDPGRGWPLVLLGHGGNAQMSQARAEGAAADIIHPFMGEAERRGFILAAPATARGWGTIGYSILFSLLSKLSREFHLDPDRVYAAGHSMGGHMSWRCGINFPDRWGAVGPMSGGYDFVADGQVHSLSNVPGFATYGRDEPFQINDFNRKIAAWMEQQGYPWILREKRGGHEIFRDELPAIFEFFNANPRDLYRKGIYVRAAGPLRLVESESRKEGWSEHPWRRDRPIPGDVFHWVRLFPAENPRQVQEALVGWRAGNQIKVTANGISQLRLYLHASMVDFDKPIELFVNGETQFVTVRPDPAAMLELVREFDDRGRIFHAALDVAVRSDLPVPVPRFA